MNWRPLGLAALGAARLLAAQEPARARRDTTDSLRAHPIERVVVTGAPLELPATPLAVASTSRDEIRAGRAGLALDEALRAVPGVQVDNRFNYAVGERISIRGFGARSQFGVRGIRVVVDGIPATLPDGQTNLNNIDLGSLGRVEVIRGPAAALYGNASGGVLYFESEPAARERAALRARVTAGPGGRRSQATASGTSGPYSWFGTASRLSANGPRAYDDATVSAASARLVRRLARGVAQVVVSGVEFEARNPGALSDSLLRVDRHQAFRNNVVQRTGERGQQGQVGARWLTDVRGSPLEISAHLLARGIDNPIPPRIIDLTRSAGGMRVAMQRAVGPAGLSLGVEGQFQRDLRLNFVNDSGRRGARVLDQRERVAALAPFARGWLESRDGAFSVLAGLRRDRQRFSVRDRLVSSSNPDDSGDRDMGAWSPSLGITARIREGMHLYANAGTSFETPTTSELANRATGAGGFNPDLQPQRTRSIEAGLNAQVGSFLSVQASAYRATVRDALIPFEVPGSPGRQFFRNSGRATHRGAELWVRSPAQRDVVVRGSYTYTRARFDGGTSGGTSLAGRRIPGIAPHHFDGTIEVAPPARALHVALDARFLSAMPANDVNSAQSPPYAIADLRAWFTPRRATYLVPFAGISNLANRDYNASVVINAVGRRYFEPGPGRTFYLGLEARVVPR